jgi:hypothetical protein
MADINTPLGEVVNGIIGGEAKDLIEQLASYSSVYKIESYSEEKLEDKDVIKYQISLDYDKIKELNTKVKEQYNLKGDFDVSINRPEVFNIYVDKSNNQIIRLVFSLDGVNAQVDYSEFNKDFEIVKPSNK